MNFDDLNGTYSAVMSAPAGSSTAVLVIRDGRIFGNDIAGARYDGTVTVNQDGSIAFHLVVTVPPGAFAVWGTTPSDIFMTREMIHTVPPGEFIEGRAIVLPREQATVMFRRIPDNFATLAGQDGLRLMIANLQNAEAAWKIHDAVSGGAHD